jgi:ABC-type phosphate/phosphonate transport system substrate-binding protein
MLRFVTYLAPSLPLELFETIVRRVAAAAGMPASLDVETGTSAPPPDRVDPFSSDEADVGFLCAPGWAALAARRPAPVELIAAPVFDDPRAERRPVYFADVVVRRAAPVRALAELATARWAYNDECSLSGYHAIRRALGGHDATFLRAGSHLGAIDRVLAGEADAASVDSNVLALWRRREPVRSSELRAVGSWGPYPIQPVVARTALAATVKDALRRALCGLHVEPSCTALRELGLLHFVAVSERDYWSEREAFACAESGPGLRAPAREAS